MNNASKNGNNLLFAILISLLLHILLIAIFVLFETKSKEEEPSKIKLGNVKLKEAQEKKLPTAPPKQDSAPAQKEEPKVEPTPTPPAPPTPKPEPKPKKEEPKPQKPKELPQKVEKPTPTPKKEPVPVPDKNVTTPPQKESLGKFLSKPSMPSINDIANSFIDQKIEELYGDEFGKLSDAQKEFIKDNLSAIGSITQKHLKYPSVAGELGQSGMNIVEFNLHPNGDITDLRVSKDSGYALLDRNSIRTIEIAYKDYPRPKEVTKIKIYVQYVLYR